jgi:flagellar hook-basal body complex protein FliE
LLLERKKPASVTTARLLLGLFFPEDVSDILAPLSLILFATCLVLLFYSLRLQAKLSRLTREYARQRAVSGQAARAARRDAESHLSEALDLVSDAIYLVECYMRDASERAEELKEVVYALEDAEEALDKLVRKRKPLS